MVILGVSGSPRGRRSSTRGLMEQVLAGAQAVGAQTDLIDLTELQLAYCQACDACHARGPCPQPDEFATLGAKMQAADGLVWGSPLYFNSVTAQLKTMIDRLSEVIHCQRYLGKYAASVCVSGGPEFDRGVAYMNEVLQNLGCDIVGGVGAAAAIPGAVVAAGPAAVALGADLASAIREQRPYPEQAAVHAGMRDRFRRLVDFNRERWPHEFEYWSAQGWLPST